MSHAATIVLLLLSPLIGMPVLMIVIVTMVVMMTIVVSITVTLTVVVVVAMAAMMMGRASTQRHRLQRYASAARDFKMQSRSASDRMQNGPTGRI